LWVDGEIVNRPSDGHERGVANGLMMVNLLPKEASQAFQEGDRVRANELIDLSMGPGDLYQTPNDIGQGDVGIIIEERHDLQGVLATGDNWWKVDFDGRLGWVRETSLDLADSAEPAQSTNPTATPAIDDPKTMMSSLNWLLGRALRRPPLYPIIP
jgi:hypothetical protein